MFNTTKILDFQSYIEDVLSNPITNVPTVAIPIWTGHAIGLWRMEDEWERYMNELKRSWVIFTLLIGYGFSIGTYVFLLILCSFIPAVLPFINEVINIIVLFIGCFAWIRLSSKANREKRIRQRRIRILMNSRL